MSANERSTMAIEPLLHLGAVLDLCDGDAVLPTRQPFAENGRSDPNEACQVIRSARRCSVSISGSPWRFAFASNGKSFEFDGNSLRLFLVVVVIGCGSGGHFLFRPACIASSVHTSHLWVECTGAVCENHDECPCFGAAALCQQCRPDAQDRDRGQARWFPGERPKPFDSSPR